MNGGGLTALWFMPVDVLNKIELNGVVISHHCVCDMKAVTRPSESGQRLCGMKAEGLDPAASSA